MDRIRPLSWHSAKGDSPGDRLFEATESPGNPGSDVWKIAIHDDGPAWNWFRDDSTGQILDIGHGADPEDCKRQIEARRRADFPVFRPSRIPPLAVAAAIAIGIALVAVAVWP